MRGGRRGGLWSEEEIASSGTGSERAQGREHLPTGGPGTALPWAEKSGKDPLDFRMVPPPGRIDDQGGQDGRLRRLSPASRHQHAGRRLTGVRVPEPDGVRPQARGEPQGKNLRETVRGRDEGEPSPRGEVPSRRGVNVRHRAGPLVAGDFLPGVRVPPPLADFPVRGVGDHEVERPGGEPGKVFPEIAQDGGETAPEPALPALLAGA